MIRKELIRVFCCSTVQIVNLQESQISAFSSHEFLCSMETRFIIKRWDLLLFKCIFNILSGSNKIQPLMKYFSKYGFPSLSRSNTKRLNTKKHWLGCPGGQTYKQLGSKTTLKYPYQLLYSLEAFDVCSVCI